MEHETILEQYKNAVDKGSIFSKTDLNGNITYVNKQFCDASGYTQDELIGHTHAIIKHPDTSSESIDDMWKEISSGKTWRGVFQNRKKDGSSYYVNSIIFPIKDDDGKILEYISMRQDITELVKSKHLLEIYSKDMLTNLPNEQKCNELLDNNSNNLMAILLDIKDFSLVKEFYGDEISDSVLSNIALKLQSFIIDKNTQLYKLHSDKYMLIVSDENLFDRYNSLIKFTLLTEDNFIVNDIVVNFNIGIAYGSDNLFYKTSMALREAKKMNCTYYVYSEPKNAKEVRKKNLEKFNNIKQAILDDRVEPYFQPIVDAKTEKVIKYEALARIIDTDGRMMPISEFLDVTENSCFFENFMRQIVQKVFLASSQSNKEVSVNLTYKNINSVKFVEYIEYRLQKHTGPAITFEILESEQIEDYDVLENFINMVKKYGSLIAIDDFGTGYSNFSHLNKFKADFIKIDGSIISKVEEDANSKLILIILVEYAKKTNMKVIAEYVSDAEIAKSMKDLGVDLLQGYYYGKAENAKHYNLV